MRKSESDVRWLDEVALHQAVVAGDREAFAELMRRFDPVVRAQVSRVSGEAAVDEEVAGFWCGLLADDLVRLRGWEPELGGLLAQWLMVLAAQVCAIRRRAVA